MKTCLLHIYDFFSTHRRWLWGGLTAVLLVLIGLAASLRYDEDIMDFLPVTDEEREALHQYQAKQAASQIVLIIEGDSLRDEALDKCFERIPDLEYEPDISEHLEAFYSMMPAYVADSTYDKLDSLFTPEAIRAALERDKLILSTPGAGAFATAIQYDPLGLINLSSLRPTTAQANDQQPTTYAYFTSPYGGTETLHNAALIDSLTAITNDIAADYPNINIRWIGAPVIAVGNARRIKTDTLLCLALALVFITALLAYAFPRRRDLFLILLSVSFGWLTGMAVLRLVTPMVSAVVIGIGSVLIGIAVNYPLHLLVHQRYTTSVRQTLDEVLSPLVVGNITTVGAFLALVPLQATALQHLGIFAASMLVGTILFCVLVLPQLMSAEPTPVRDIKLPIVKRQSSIHTFQYTLLALTVLLGALYLSPFVNQRPSLFDSNLSHINYMTDRQRADMAGFDMPKGDATRWTDYWQHHDAEATIALIRSEAEQAGFNPDAFTPFYNSLQPTISDCASEQPTTFNYNSIARRLSDDFDYLGLCCSIIVFIFLVLSFRNVWLALIAFVPMVLSWVWIFAIMQLIGIQFNIVNVILATFIFGQGDDYTIFIVEGLVYEHRTGKPMLPQYRQSIILSAVIMLIGIGILVFAKHPAMHSLGAVTLIGMTVTLLMATTIPPILFRWYTALSKQKV